MLLAGKSVTHDVIEGLARLLLDGIAVGEGPPAPDSDITYMGSTSSAYARRPTRYAARTVVPAPEKLLKTVSPRDVVSFMTSSAFLTVA